MTFIPWPFDSIANYFHRKDKPDTVTAYMDEMNIHYGDMYTDLEKQMESLRVLGRKYCGTYSPAALMRLHALFGEALAVGAMEGKTIK